MRVGSSEGWIAQGFLKALGKERLALVFVGVVAVHRVLVPVVQVVDVIFVFHAFVPAFFAMHMSVVGVGLTLHFMFVDMPLVHGVLVAVMVEIFMIAVLNRFVAAVGCMGVIVQAFVGFSAFAFPIELLDPEWCKRQVPGKETPKKP